MPVRPAPSGPYLPVMTSTFLAEAFCSVFSPTEMVRMPSL
jgi:hypothetical protein